ncbi:serine/threonine-protein kinase PLK1-like [Centruroides sculpturatus]|uniref:serine/threonine-protein kinase PLK1-like n=1 Tax=Centruroides sculpturatus TaxID=218467 RepID=UPI000C6DD376|nr:serine/threonine-protein kinase PLK1-like [Centruroides sculpturatus]
MTPILREIELHRSLTHKRIVRFHHFFEDDDHVYIVLEYCTRKSLVHVLKNRKLLTEPEVRYFMLQFLEGVDYIHRKGIIHRDLKLGNLFLTENMELKIGDFGLATYYESEKNAKMTVCGTPNYIAPEVLNMEGHYMETDIWAVGCIMYAMLVGQPPFETSTLTETYARIVGNKYSLPDNISEPAADLIMKMLKNKPTDRPSIEQILKHSFFTTGYTPTELSPMCCMVSPKFPSVVTLSR